MDLYALSFEKALSVPLADTQLHFLESDIIGHAQKSGEDLEKAMEKIREAEDGIRRHNHEAKPDWHNCRVCDFRTICPYSYAY